MILVEEPLRRPTTRPVIARLGLVRAPPRLTVCGGGPGVPLPSVFLLARALILLWLRWAPRSSDLVAQAYRGRAACPLASADLMANRRRVARRPAPIRVDTLFSLACLFTSAPASSAGPAS